MKIKTIKNVPISSNCYVVHHENNKNCIVIDPGSKDVLIIKDEIGKKKVDFIILTHEHFDHLWGTDILRNDYCAKLCCSEAANRAIVDRKKNLSLFYNQVGFELSPCDIILTEGQIIDWYDVKILIFLTPGHTPGSICIKIEDNLFTGDTFIRSIDTVTKLPGGSPKDLEKSLQKLKVMGMSKLNLYCGHGE